MIALLQKKQNGIRNELQVSSRAPVDDDWSSAENKEKQCAISFIFHTINMNKMILFFFFHSLFSFRSSCLIASFKLSLWSCMKWNFLLLFTLLLLLLAAVDIVCDMLCVGAKVDIWHITILNCTYFLHSTSSLISQQITVSLIYKNISRYMTSE